MSDIGLVEVAQAIDEIVAAAASEQEVLNQCSSLNCDASSSHCCEKVMSKPKRPKCRVHFADDDGKELFKSKDCPPSDVPPDLDVQAILKDAYVPPTIGGMGAIVSRNNSVEKPPGKWAYKDPQPMDDYSIFAQTMEAQLVLAENIYLTNDKLICTVKVKCVKKVSRVFARITFNNWISYDDVDLKLIPIQGLAATPTSVCSVVMYQRYVLEMPLPPVPPTIEAGVVGSNIQLCFCLVFEDREERWDNHFGRNYVMECVANDATDDASEQQQGDTPSFSVIAHHMQANALITDEEQRYKSQLRAMSPEYTYYNESSEFYW